MKFFITSYGVDDPLKSPMNLAKINPFYCIHLFFCIFFSNEIHHVESDRDFDDELRKAGDQLVIVGFINSTHREAHYLQYYLPVKVYIIEVDVKKDKKWVMDRYGLNIMPSCIFLENGEVLKRLEDAKTHQINAAYEAIISDPYLQNRKKGNLL